MNKKVVVIVAVLLILLSFFSICMAATVPATFTSQDNTYEDISGHWAEKAIYKWSSYGVIKGSGGLFRPNDTITRGEMACILNNMMGYQTIAKNTFSDLHSGKFYTEAVLKANAAGIISGDGATKVRPVDKVTREEAVVMMAKAFAVGKGSNATTTFIDTDKVSSWAKASVLALESKKYISGNGGRFNPKANITRAEAVAIINNIVKAYYAKAGTYTDNVSGTAVVKAADVVLKNMTVSEDLIIAEGVGQGDVKLDSVNVKGNTVVRGGGENSIHISGKSNITNIRIEKVNDKLRIVVEDGNTVKEIEISKGEEIIITGAVENIDVQVSDVTIYATAANIKNATFVEGASKIIVDKTSKISSILVNNKAQSVNIQTENGSVISTITASSKITVNGTGTVEKVVLNKGADNSNISTPNTQTTAADGVTGAISGGKVIPEGGTVKNDSTGLATGVTVPGVPTGGSTGNENNTTPAAIAVSSISTTPTAITLTEKGQAATITVIINPSNATNKMVSWSSSNTGVATVVNGIVTPVSEGKATITVTSDADKTKFAKVEIVVNKAEVEIPDTEDKTAPVLSNGIVEDLGSVAGTTATLKFNATQETGTVKYYYLLQDSSAIAPDVATIKALNKWGTASGNPVYYQINLTGLTLGQNYSAYIVMEDAAGNTSNVLAITGIKTYSTADTTAPVLSNGIVEDLGSVAGTTATLKFNATQETGTVKYYYLLQDSSAIAPDVATIKALNKWGTASGNPVYYQINLTGLTLDQKYSAYIVMEDAAGNTSNVLPITGVNPYSNVAAPTMEISYVLNFNKDEVDRALMFSFEGSNNASKDSLTVDTTKIKVKIGTNEYQLSSYSKATSGLAGTYDFVYGDTPTYLKLYLNDVDYNAITGDANFSSSTTPKYLVADLGWASINGIISGKASDSSISFSRNLTIINNSDEYIAKYQNDGSYHYYIKNEKISNVSYSVSSITFFSERVPDSSIEPTKGFKIVKNITTGSSITFESDDIWTRLSGEATPSEFAPTDTYYKVSAADTDRVLINGTYYKVAQGVAGRLNSLLTYSSGDSIVDKTNAFTFKFGANGTLEAITVIAETEINISLVGHFAPQGIPVYLNSNNALLTIIGDISVGDITVINANKAYYGSITVFGGKVGNVTLIDGVKLRICGSEELTEVGNISGTGAFGVSVEVGSTNGRSVSIGNIAFGTSGRLNLQQNFNANDLLAENFTIGNITQTGGLIIDIPLGDCNPYGWFKKFKDIGNDLTFMSGDYSIYTPPTNEITINGGNSLSLENGVLKYYDDAISKYRFFFTDAILSESDLQDSSKTFTFSAVDATDKCELKN